MEDPLVEIINPSEASFGKSGLQKLKTILLNDLQNNKDLFIINTPWS